MVLAAPHLVGEPISTRSLPIRTSLQRSLAMAAVAQPKPFSEHPGSERASLIVGRYPAGVDHRMHEFQVERVVVAVLAPRPGDRRQATQEGPHVGVAGATGEPTQPTVEVEELKAFPDGSRVSSLTSSVVR